MKLIPFFGVKRENKKYKKIYSKIINNSLATGKSLQGEEIINLETKLATMHKKNYAVAVNSCTDALFFSLKLLKLKPETEVLITNYSYIASVSSIIRANLVPRFVDIQSDYNMNLENIEKSINKKTKVILYVHLFGKIGNITKLKRICKKYKLILIEDVAQAFGAKFKNVIAGQTGKFSCLSFDPTKIISAPGSGGAVLCNKKNDYLELKKLRYHGKIDNYFNNLGYNSQMPSMVAAIIQKKIELNKKNWEKKRKSIAKQYINKLKKFVDVPFVKKNSLHVYHKFVIKTKQRDFLQEYLKRKKIQTMIHYEVCLSDNPYLKKYKDKKNKFINSDIFSRESLSLPIHPFLTKKEINHIINSIIDFFKSNKK